ncbi:hypothetical protein ABZ719_33410 [Streptomyces sp. NPDC006743]|uniref:hypothetical protein n=1 Tax=Streptomyces sp. NPDC006743 TaxID=3154480 RepID=UPI003457211A
MHIPRRRVGASPTLPHHNGRTEGANTKIKLLERLMYGRAGHLLRRHVILLD